MHRLKCPINGLVMLFVLTLPAWSQTQRYAVPAGSVADDFVAYGQALNSAADSALKNVIREAAARSQIVEAEAKTKPLPNANVLHQFAEQYWKQAADSSRDESIRSCRDGGVDLFRPQRPVRWQPHPNYSEPSDTVRTTNKWASAINSASSAMH